MSMVLLPQQLCYTCQQLCYTCRCCIRAFAIKVQASQAYSGTVYPIYFTALFGWIMCVCIHGPDLLFRRHVHKPWLSFNAAGDCVHLVEAGLAAAV